MKQTITIGNSQYNVVETGIENTPYKLHKVGGKKVLHTVRNQNNKHAIIVLDSQFDTVAIFDEKTGNPMVKL